MPLITHTVTLRTELPGGDPLEGVWATSVYATPPLARDTLDHNVIAGKDPEPTVDGVAVLVLEETGQPNLEPADFRWQISFKSKDGNVKLGPFVFELTQDTTLDEIAESSGVPVDSSILAQTLAAAGSAAADAAQAAADRAAIEAIGTSLVTPPGPATVTPLYVETQSTGLLLTSPANLRTGLAATQHADGGYVTELEIAVTGTKGSRVLTSSEPAKVAGLGASPWAGVLNNATADFFVAVIGNDGATQITLSEPLTADFVGTLSPKYDAALGQHITAAATKALARHAAAKTGLTASRGRLIAGTLAATPPAANQVWVRNAALIAYGVSNSVAPVVQSQLAVHTVGNMNIDTLHTARPLAEIAGVRVGCHLAGHGAEATLRPGKRPAVVEFWVAAYRGTTSASPATGAQLQVTVTGDGATLYSRVHGNEISRIVVPVRDVESVTISVTNLDGGIYYMSLSQLNMREAGDAAPIARPAAKILTLGDSWFAFYLGLFAGHLGAVTGADVFNFGRGGHTLDSVLVNGADGRNWLDVLLAQESPDEVWFHFYVNDSIDQSAVTFLAPDGTAQAMQPVLADEAARKVHWKRNIDTAIARCQRAGAKPVIFVPGGTAANSQATRLARFAWYLDAPSPVDGYAATAAELDALAALVNVSGKQAGRSVFNATAGKPVYAAGSAAADLWKDAAAATVNTPV